MYDYLGDRIQRGVFKPGNDPINVNNLCKRLGVSKTPLRDAFIQLEMEGFVTIRPRNGIYVNGLSLTDIRNYYQIIGALEASALHSAAGVLTVDHFDSMQHFNDEMTRAIAEERFDLFYRNNLRFHDVYLEFCGNSLLNKEVQTLKKRLYDFILKRQWIREWEEKSVQEHQALILHLRNHEIHEAANLLTGVHWSYDVQSPYIERYYQEKP